jgi:N-glycosylase/DNA lyase
MKEFLDAYQTRKKAITQQLAAFTTVRGDDVFYELCFCLLTPQSSGLRADACVQELKALDFLHNPVDLLPILRKKIRFHNNKAKYLLEVKRNYSLLKKQILTLDPFPLRDYLLTHVRGFGLKETHHFLRNIGYRNFAILDRHILKNLKRFKVIRNLPKTLTKKRYFKIEQRFKDFSERIGISLDELDLLFWSMETGVVFK